MDPVDTWPAIEGLTGSVTMSRTTLYGIARRGAISAAKIGNPWRFDREEIDQKMKAKAPDSGKGGVQG